MARPDLTGKITRPRLEERLEVGGLARLTALNAGPGSGKTTLLTQCFEGRHAVWHTLTPADRSLSIFARNVVRKLRLVAPQMSSELLTAVEGARGPDVSLDSGRAMAIAAALAQDLDTALARDVVLVLDDVHEIGPSGDSANFLAALCRHVPVRLRVITASRSALPFPTSRLRVAGDLDEITAAEMAFTVNEIEDLIAIRLGREDPELAKEVSSLTGGWPVATVLAVEFDGHNVASTGSTLLEQSALFDYLAEEVLGAEDPHSIAQLRDVSMLPWVDPELLQHLGVDLSHMLSETSVYMGSAPDVPGASVVSPLVREYLLERHPIADDHRQALLIPAAGWYRDRGDLTEALACLQLSDDAGAIVEFLNAEGDAMVAAGLTRHVIEAIDHLSPEDLTPSISLMDAEVRQLLGDWEGALERYRGLVPEEGPIPAAVAWRLGFLKHMQGRVGEALETYSRGELGTGDHRAEAALLGWTASAHWLRGERDRAKELADGALDLAQRSDDPRSMATAHTVLALVAAMDGDRAANDVHYLKALEHAERGRDVVQTIRIRSNRASAFLEEGEFDAALAELDIALRLADMTGFELWRGMSLSNRAQVHAFRGRIEEAVADLSEARTAFRRIGSLLESYPVAHLGDVYRTRGDSARARAAYEEAIVMAEGQHDLQVLVPACSGLARLIAAREPQTALEVSQRATDVDAGIGRALALVASGWASHHAGDSVRAADLAREAAHVARSRRDPAGLGESLELSAAVDPGRGDEYLDEAMGIWRGLDAPIAVARIELARARRTGRLEGAARARGAADALQRHGAIGLAREAREAAEAMARHVIQTDLAIKTLGGFDIVVGGESTPRSAWQSKVAREVLWMLVAARGRPLNREVLMDRLWPDDDATKASNRLSVALSTIRKVLDPGGAHPSDRHIVSDRDAVRFDRANTTIDVEEFLEDAKAGRRFIADGSRDRGLALLRAAEERYVGDFLEEDPYADWAISLREEARAEFLTIAASLADAATEEGDHDGASRRYLRMLERDPFNEPAHIGLIVSMRRSGRHGTARRLYGNYVARMSDLDVEPEPFPDSPTRLDHSYNVSNRSSSE